MRINPIPQELIGHLGKPAREKSIYFENNAYFFKDLEIMPGKFKTIGLDANLLDGGKRRTYLEWRDYGRANNLPICNSVVLYQMMHHLYRVRNDPEMKDISDAVLRILHEDWKTNHPHTATKIDYYHESLRAVIYHGWYEDMEPCIISRSIEMPELPQRSDPESAEEWQWLTLARKQPCSDLGKTEPIPDSMKPLLEALLGPHAEEVGAVCQYICGGSQLPDVRFIAPVMKSCDSNMALRLELQSKTYQKQNNTYQKSQFTMVADKVSDDNFLPARGVITERIT